MKKTLIFTSLFSFIFFGAVMIGDGITGLYVKSQNYEPSSTIIKPLFLSLNNFNLFHSVVLILFGLTLLILVLIAFSHIHGNKEALETANINSRKRRR